jgi:hypothetical protein
LPIYTPSNNISFSHIVKPYLIFSVTEIVPIPISSISDLPDWALREIKTACVNFIWNNGSHLVKYNTIINEKCNGGLQLPDIVSKIKAFRLKFVIRFLDNDCKF